MDDHHPRVFTKPNKAPGHQDLVDRYAILQRKVHDLEQLHADGRKAHLSEQENLKAELARAKLTSSDYADRITKLKRHAEIQDSRMNELKKTVATNDIDIKDLRARLRKSEQERILLSSKKHETTDVKKALQALELKRKKDLKERDRKIYQLEQTIAADKRRREAADVAAKQLVQETEATKAAQDAAQTAQRELEALREKSSLSESDLLSQLQMHKELLRRVTEEFGKLASQAADATAYHDLKHKCASDQMRIARLERKSANSDAQVAELAHLIRQANEKNNLLESQLQDADCVLSSIIQVFDNPAELATSDEELDNELTRVHLGICECRYEIERITSLQQVAFADLDRQRTHDLLLSTNFLQHMLAVEEAGAHFHASEIAQEISSRNILAAQLDQIRVDFTAAQQQIADNVQLLKKTRSEAESLKRALDEAIIGNTAEARKTAEAIAKEREATQRLTTAMQKNRVEEEGLRAEIEQLTSELAQAEGCQEAYRSLSEEVASLLDRNTLAEDETTRLRKFNAEILGHHNPAQRILYVDRIRQELADTKHKLLQSTRANDLAAEANNNLRGELGLYKSVMVPAEQKTRTNITRLTRPPLANQSLNVTLSRSTKDHSGSTMNTSQFNLPDLPPIPGDMTLEDIM